MGDGMQVGTIARFPQWVPVAVRHYLAHTEAGYSIRALARATDCHPSTILRQVRRFEGRRDDPLVDAALNALSPMSPPANAETKKEIVSMTPQTHIVPTQNRSALSNDQIDQEAKRVLRRMCEPGAVMAVARDMETAVVVRETADGGSLRTAIVNRDIAQALALKGWIGCQDDNNGRISRYFITNAGRAALRQLIADDENRAQGFADARQDFICATSGWSQADKTESIRAHPRYYTTESPLLGLARRKDRDGAPFLSKDLVAAGERLREDFELSRLAMDTATSWERYMDGVGEESRKDVVPKDGAHCAEGRVRTALRDLGPGLGDIVLRCCCLLEGLEITEKNLGWSARSGKIVLRIALTRLKRHYAETQGTSRPLIG